MGHGSGAKRVDADLDGEGLVIGVVMSRFNEAVVDALLDNCLRELGELGVRAEDISVVSLPGALEIPLALQAMAQTDRYDALVALGAVIRGETYHFEIVAETSAAGIQRVQLDTGVPVANGVLTTDTDEQAEARLENGADAARVAIEMANLLRAIDDE
jgi:6,7-dimethyl-8-ribityllumazine synthase